MKRLRLFLQNEELDPDSANHIEEAAMGNLYTVKYLSYYVCKVTHVLFLVTHCFIFSNTSRHICSIFSNSLFYF